jgi:Lambda phage tail tube protein, TTP
MAASTVPMIGLGTTLGYKFGSAVTYTLLATIVDLDDDFSVGEAETTVLSATAKTYLPTLFDGGDVTLNLRYVPGDTGIKELVVLIGAPVIGSWQITFPDATTETFNGFLKGMGKSIENESAIDTSVTIKVSGAVVTTTT